VITVVKDFNRFKVKISEPGTGWRGFSLDAENLPEVKLVLDHYIGGEHGYGSKVAECPLCQKVATYAETHKLPGEPRG
jgi:hypothetical protein